MQYYNRARVQIDGQTIKIPPYQIVQEHEHGGGIVFQTIACPAQYRWDPDARTHTKGKNGYIMFRFVPLPVSPDQRPTGDDIRVFVLAPNEIS